MKVNDLVTLSGIIPVTCSENSVWRIELISAPYAVIEIVKPWSVYDHRWIGELAQVSLSDLKLFTGRV